MWLTISYTNNQQIEKIKEKKSIKIQKQTNKQIFDRLAQKIQLVKNGRICIKTVPFREWISLWHFGIYKAGEFQYSSQSILPLEVSLQTPIIFQAKSEILKFKIFNMDARFETVTIAEEFIMSADDQLVAELKIWEQLKELKRRMHKACQQITILDRKLQEIYKRFQDASNALHKAARYNLKLKLVTTEGVRTAYYLYTMTKADEIQELEEKLQEYQAEEYDDDEEEEDETMEYDSELDAEDWIRTKKKI